MNLQELIDNHHKPELAKIDNEMVYQVWDDGEITLQKGGSLLWERNLHCIAPAFDKQESECLWPEVMDNNGFIFTTEEGAAIIRREIERLQ